jgi:predicted AlkP superfamily phosphohydrolase/phosphomutase
VPKVAALGLDAAEWSLLERRMAAGALPNLAGLRERSARCELRNVVAYRSEVPWTQFVSGQEPSESHYWSTVDFDPQAYEAFTVGAHDVDPFYAFGPELPVIAFDIPHSTISDGVEGAQVTAWGSHSPQYPRAARPSGLLREIDATLGVHPAFGNDSDLGWFAPAYVDNLAEALVVGAERRVAILTALQERIPDWGLLVSVMSEPHSAGHHFWHGVDEDHPLYGLATSDLAGQRLHDVLEAVDAAVGRFVASMPRDAIVVVFSLHGMQANNNDLPSTVLLPELLHRATFGRGLLRSPDARRWRESGFPPIALAPEDDWYHYMRERFTDGPRDRVRHAVRRILPPGAFEALRRLAGKPPRQPAGELGEPIPPEVDLGSPDARPARTPMEYQATVWWQRHWPAMRAFVLPTFSDGHVRVNVAGREASGTVAVEDYVRVCDEIVDLVRACRNPRTGNAVVADVIRTSDDPFDPDKPPADLVFLWSEAIDAFEHPDLGTIGPFPFIRTGEHSSNGFALFSGPEIEARDLGVQSATDLTPTILRLLGREPGARLSGRPIAGIARSETRTPAA